MKIITLMFLVIGFSLSVQAKTFHVDFTVTSAEGCTFHIVGELDVDIKIPLANSVIKGFQGTITVGGASGCPRGTFNVSFGLVTGTPELPGEEEQNVLHELLWNELVDRGIIGEINE